MGNNFFPAVQYLQQYQPDNALSDLAKAAAIKSSQQQTQQSAQLFPGELQKQTSDIALGKQAVAAGALEAQRNQEINDAYKNAVTKNPDGTTSIDPNAVQNALAVSGHAAVAIPAVTKGLMDMQKLSGDLATQKATLASGEADAAGAAAQAILATGKTNPDGTVSYDPNIKNLVFQHLASAGYQNEVQQLQNHLQQAPQTETQIYKSMVAASPKQQQFATEAATAAAKTSEASTEAQKENYIEKMGGSSPDLQAQNAWLAKNPGKDASDYQIMMKKLVPAYNFNLQNNSGAAPSAADPLVQAVANGSMKIGDVITYRTPLAMRKQFLNSVLQVNPNYKASEYDIQTGLTKEFTTGTAAKNLTAFNTAIDHAKQLDAATDALDNGDIRGLNKIGNALGYEFGSDKTTNFNVIKNALAGEISKVFKGGQATDAEIKQVEEPFTSANSTKQLKGAIKQAQALMVSKRDALQQQYNAGQQGKPNFGNDTGNSKFSVSAPNGKTYNFPDQASLDAFKAKAGIR